MQITEMTIADYDEAFSLWETVDGVGLHEDSDSKEGIAQYLERNPGLSFVARGGGKLVGAVLCGHDGRRGYLHHLAVAGSHRRKGIGQALVQRVIERLKTLGILRCHIFVFGDNIEAQKFWQEIGWTEYAGLKVMSKGFGPSEQLEWTHGQ